MLKPFNRIRLSNQHKSVHSKQVTDMRDFFRHKTGVGI